MSFYTRPDIPQTTDWALLLGLFNLTTLSFFFERDKGEISIKKQSEVRHITGF